MNAETPLLSVRNLRTYFPIRRGVMRKVVGHVHAVEDVSFDLRRRDVYALVGESGCGKSTTGLSVLRLVRPTAGEVLFEGADLTKLSEEEMRVRRRQMQLVFQNPYASLNPRMSVYRLLAEPLRTHFSLSRAELDERVRGMAARVGLTGDQLSRYPHQFSGGQKQRIAIARALIAEPQLVVADEPVSALDVSIQAQILNLMMELQQDMALSLLFISHDLNVVRHLSSAVGVMYLGRIVESGPTEALYGAPTHPYTRALLAAVPVRDPLLKKKREVLSGDVPNPASPPSGCPFHTRCPAATARCREEMPPAREVSTGHTVCCWNA